MSWGSRYPVEQQAAQHALLAASRAISAELAHFSGWLMAAGGASFALLVVNVDAVLKHVGSNSFKWALVWFACSLLAGLIGRWLAAGVAGVCAAIEPVQARAERCGPTHRFNLLAFTKFMADASLPIYRHRAWRGFRQTRTGDMISGIGAVVRKSQYQSLLTLLQVVLVVVSVAVLAHGVKA